MAHRSVNLGEDYTRWMQDVNRGASLAGEIGKELARIDPAELRKRAVLRVRCQDCAGRIVAWIAYANTRPLLWARQRDGTGGYSLLDDGFWGDTAWCRAREYVLRSEDIVARLPGRGSNHVVDVRVSHRGSTASMQ